MKPNTIYKGNSLEVLKAFPDESIDCVMTSPPYWALRDYGVEGQLGLEPTFQEYINKLCDIFDEIKRVLKKTGTCWVNLGDTYSSQSSYSDKGRQGFEEKTANMSKLMKKRFDEKPTGKQSTRCGRGRNANVPEKSLCQIPFRFSIEMVNRGWILRNTIIWHKGSCMPASVKDRFTVDFEYVFFFAKNKKYFFEQQTEPSIDKESYLGRRPRNAGTMAEYDLKNYAKAGSIGDNGKLNGVGKTYPNRNKRAVWKINPKPFPEAHFAVYPEELCETPIKAGCPKDGIVLDPFFGSGTTGIVALKQNKKFVGIELSQDYINIANKRLKPYLEQQKLGDYKKRK